MSDERNLHARPVKSRGCVPKLCVSMPRTDWIQTGCRWQAEATQVVLMTAEWENKPSLILTVQPCQGPTTGGGPDSYDIVIGPRTNRDALGEARFSKCPC